MKFLLGQKQNKRDGFMYVGMGKDNARHRQNN